MYKYSEAKLDVKALFEDVEFKALCSSVNPKLKTDAKTIGGAINSAYKILLKLIGRKDLYTKLSNNNDELLVCDRFAFLVPLLAGFYLCENFTDDKLAYMRHQITSFVKYYKDYIKEPRIYIGDYDFKEMLNLTEESYEKDATDEEK